jgi:hypothetical protein
MTLSASSGAFCAPAGLPAPRHPLPLGLLPWLPRKHKKKKKKEKKKRRKMRPWPRFGGPATSSCWPN